MRKFYQKMSILLIVFCAKLIFAQAFTESFNDITTLAGNGWAMQNNSSPVGNLSWFQGLATTATPSGPFNSYNGAANAYIAANYSSTGNSGTISNWLITPNRTLRNGDVFTFYTRKPTVGVGQTDYADRLEVRLSTNGASTNVGANATLVGDFTTLLLSINPTLVANVYPQVWTQYTITISGLPAPTSGRIAFRYFVTDGGYYGTNSDYIGIDQVDYTPYVCPAFTMTPGGALTGGSAGNAYSTSLTQTGALGAPSYAITAGALPPGLTLSASGTISGTPTATGTFNFTVTVNDASGCSGYQSYSITVVCPPNPITIADFPVLCSNNGLYTLSEASPAGGTYSGTGVSGGQFDPTVGTQTITYNYIDAYGCSHSSSKTITVNTAPTVTLDTFSAICSNSGLLTLSGGLPAGGTYSGTGVSGGQFDPSVGTQTITYTYTDANGCSSSAIRTITVNATPIVDDINDQIVCNETETSEITFTNSTSGDVTYSWTNNNTNIGLAATGTGSIPSFTATNITDEPIVATITVTPSKNTNTGLIPEVLYYKFDGSGTTVPNLASSPPLGTDNATIMGGLAQGGSAICNGTLIGTGQSSNSDYLNTGWAPNLGSGSWTISFKSENIGPSTTLYYAFGDANTNTFRCFTNGVAGANNWILRGAGLMDISINGGATVEPHTNTFVYDASANEVRAYLDGVLVNTVAQGSVNLTGTGPFKVNGYATNVGSPVGGHYDEFMLFSRALTPAEVATLNGCTINASCAGSPKTFTITVNPSPKITAQPTVKTICAGSSTTFSATASNATGYQWQVDQGAGFVNITNGAPYSGATTATLTITGATAGLNGYLYRVIATGSCSPNATSNSASLTVSSTVAPTGVSTQSFNAGDTLSVLVVNGQNVKWYATESDATNHINDLPISTLIVNNTTYYATQTVGGCESQLSLAVKAYNETLSISDLSKKSQISIYPNPVREVLNFSGQDKISKVVIMSIDGKKVSEKNMNGERKIDVHTLIQGTYLINIFTENGVQTIKFIKN